MGNVKIEGITLGARQQQVIAALVKAGGELVPEEGETIVKREQWKKLGVENADAKHNTSGRTVGGSFSMVLKKLDDQGIIERDLNEKRTYRVALTPEWRDPERLKLLGIKGRNGQERTKIAALAPSPKKATKATKKTRERQRPGRPVKATTNGATPSSGALKQALANDRDVADLLDLMLSKCRHQPDAITVMHWIDITREVLS